MTDKPLLSIVITAYTAERLNDIYELLESIKNQTYKNMETIFVVERSQDLANRINSFIAEKSIPNIRVVFSNDKLGLSLARNLGIKNAKSGVIAFVDDDVVLYPDWAEGMVKLFDSESVIGVTGPAFPLWENDFLKWLPEEFYWLVSCTAWTGWEKTQPIRGAFGANMAFRKEAFSDSCLFSPNAGYTNASHHQPVSDDLEFSLRVRRKTGRPIVFDPKSKVWHRVTRTRLNWKFIIARSHQIGCTRRIIKKYYANELGNSEQERHVLKGIFKLLLGIPKESITKPKLAGKKLSVIILVLSSTAVGYLIPIPSYSLVTER